MKRKTLIASLLGAALAAGALAQDPPAITDAHTAYYHEQFGRALAMYEALAATGNAEAAERAGFMLLQGSGMFGPEVGRDPVRARALLGQAALAGRPGANFLLNLLVRSD